MKETALVGAVFDSNVHLHAAASGKSVAGGRLQLVEKGSIKLYLSKEILAEIEDVLNRPEIRNHFSIFN